MKFFVIACLILLDGTIQGQVGRLGHRGPICEDDPGQLQWAAKIIDPHKIRFTIDTSGNDECTTYFDLEFIAELFNQSNEPLGKYRFAVPNREFTGSLITSFDFQYVEAAVARVRPITLHCKKRNAGGMPGPPSRDDPLITPRHRSHNERRADYDDTRKQQAVDAWFGELEVDYAEYWLFDNDGYLTDTVTCVCGSQTQFGSGQNPDTCSAVKHAAEQFTLDRARQYGPAILPDTALK